MWEIWEQLWFFARPVHLTLPISPCHVFGVRTRGGRGRVRSSTGSNNVRPYIVIAVSIQFIGMGLYHALLTEHKKTPALHLKMSIPS